MLAALKDIPRLLIASAAVLLVSEFEELVSRFFMPLYAVNIMGISEAVWTSLNVVFLTVLLVIRPPLSKLVDVFGRRGLLIAHLLCVLATTYFILCRGRVWLAIVLVALPLGPPFFNPAC